MHVLQLSEYGQRIDAAKTQGASGVETGEHPHASWSSKAESSMVCASSDVKGLEKIAPTWRIGGALEDKSSSVPNLHRWRGARVAVVKAKIEFMWMSAAQKIFLWHRYKPFPKYCEVGRFEIVTGNGG